MKKIRIDQLMVQLGLSPSRERAQRLIMAGLVLVGDHRVKKASETFSPDETRVHLSEADHPYVGRGGLKLAQALQHFNILVKAKIAVDVGASTGGFTDCLLQNGAKKVYAIDVGTNQLAWKLRQDERVVVHEQTHALDLKETFFTEAIDLVVMDVSFISVTKLIPHLLNTIPGKWDLVFLIKPQFEVGKDEVEAGGVIRDSAKQQAVCTQLSAFIEATGFLKVVGITPSPITGDKGNQEFLLYARRT